MSVNRYGVMAQRHWACWLPRQYAAIGDPERFFTLLGEAAARQIEDLADELAAETGQGDSYLARVGQLLAARTLAEELILPQWVLPQAEQAADDEQDDQEDVEPERGERPVVVDRGHPSWAEVDAEQHERANDPESD